jgi:hypothetical protein
MLTFYIKYGIILEQSNNAMKLLAKTFLIFTLVFFLTVPVTQARAENQTDLNTLQAQILELKVILASLQAQLLGSVPTQFECAQIRVEWVPTPGATYYKLYREGIQIYEGKNPFFTDTNLIRGRSYNYSVRAGNPAGESGFSNFKTYTALEPCPPSVPANIIAVTGTCGGNINIFWGPSHRASSYELLRGNTVIYRGPNTSFTDSNLTTGRTYNYKVRAVGITGLKTESASTASAQSSNICPPSAPSFQSPSFFVEEGYFTVNLSNIPSNSNSFKLNTSNRDIIRFSVKAFDSDITINRIDIS